MTGTKRMTNREKRRRAEVRKEMQNLGILPPDKPKLNRKKFIEETMAAWDGRDKGCLLWDIYIIRAVSCMMAHTQRGKGLQLSLEAVGAAKVLRIALRLQEFYKELNEQGKEQYSGDDLYNFIKDILDA